MNGQTGTVVLDAGDVGAVPASRTITAGAGLTGGGDLSADRTLAQVSAGAAVAVSAVDGTATTFHVIGPSPGAAAVAPIPAGWVDSGAGPLPVSMLPAGAIVVRLGDSALGEPFGLFRIPAGGATSPWESLPLAIGQVIGVGVFGSTVIAGTHAGAVVEAIAGDARIDAVEIGVDTHTHDAADITSGTVATARLGSGTADSTKFLRGDQTWATPAGGGIPPAAVRVIGNARQSDSSRFYGTCLTGQRVAADAVIAADRVTLGIMPVAACTITNLMVRVASTALTAGQSIDVACWEVLDDGLPGALEWSQAFAVGASTGEQTLSGLSLVIPTTGLWAFGVYNRSGNSGSINLQGASSVPWIGVGSANLAVLGLQSRPGTGVLPTDLSAYTVQSASTVGAVMWSTYDAAPFIAARGTLA